MPDISASGSRGNKREAQMKGVGKNLSYDPL